MDILNSLTLKSNRQIKINFDGGDLSSDAGLLLIKDFAAKNGFSKLVKKKFKTNDTSVRFHKDDENLVQMIYQIISAYFADDCADELPLDPVFHAILEKDGLASQPTLSRFFNRMDGDTLIQFDDIDKCHRDSLPIFVDSSIDFRKTGIRFCSSEHFYMFMNNSGYILWRCFMVNFPTLFWAVKNFS